MGAIIKRIKTPSDDGQRPGPSIRRKKPGAALALLLICVIASSLGCGLIGGGDDEDEALAGPSEQLRTQIQEEVAKDGKGASANAPEPTAPPSPETEAPPEPATPTPTAPAEEAIPDAAAVVENEEQARNLAWAHISQCIAFNAGELNAILITGNWFVNGTKEASRDYGFWKIPSTTAKVKPHDTQARKWESAIESQCSPESMESVPAQGRLVPDAAAAGTAVWSYLVQCIPTLSTEIFQSVYDPAKGQWAVVISPNQPNELGTWIVNPDTGAVAPHTEPARLWDTAVILGCTAEVLGPLLKPTPVPAPTPVVVEISAAVTNLWSYLVKCGPGLTVEELQATWNPVKKEWIVITAPGTEVDYGVWTVRPDGSISPGNQEATRRDQLSIGGGC